ncbi:transaldolase [Saccharospirillum impatiens]|uniref:transaldolase n=1 Tax=Saccharospirillum impatiens TaxID=169438 RepID=UPI000424D20E|nr:transaldolase [Saccharospirillum impatiens]
MSSLLEQLKHYSTVVADTGDLASITRFKPQDATTNPSLILKAVQSGQYDSLIDSLTASVQQLGLSGPEAIDELADRLIVAMGQHILAQVPGRVSTEVNARLSFDVDASLKKARRLVALYQKAEVPKDRILIKLAATWEGIMAARVLEQEDIQCNLTLIFNFAQARACAEAGAYLISPFVGRILDWHRQAEPEVTFEPEQEPGVQSVRSIYQYFRALDYPTVVMGASFRNVGEILALSGCDRLTISPALLSELDESDGQVSRMLADHPKRDTRPDPLSEAEFRWLMNEDAMATEKLAEGIRGFESDQQELERLLARRLGIE